ncbi:MAG: helix-turn-helix domain-containing protein [Candidatus Bathyarchaeota archaeon]|nr:helix-turn-helix domain-containing protein [Candidatus Bathyarchaeota archaeon]
MYLPCESIGRHLTPIFRAYLAKELIEKHGFTQVEAAKKLGITQAAVSQYLRLKRGVKGLEEFKDFLPLIESATSEVAGEIVSGKIDSGKVALKLCEICLSIRRKSLEHK